MLIVFNSHFPAIPAFAFQAIAGTHLPTRAMEGWIDLGAK